MKPDRLSLQYNANVEHPDSVSKIIPGINLN